MKVIQRIPAPSALEAMPEPTAPVSAVVEVREPDSLPDLDPIYDDADEPKKRRHVHQEPVRTELLPTPDFRPYFDSFTRPSSLVNPWERSKEFRGYCLDVPMDQYRKWPALNQGLLSHPTQAEMYHDMVRSREDDFATESSAVKFTSGTLLHWAVLEPWKLTEKHMHDHMVLSSTDSLATQKNMDLRKEVGPDMLVVRPRDLEVAFRAYDAVMAHPDAVALLEDAHNGHRDRVAMEASAEVLDAETGLWRKIRMDLLHKSPSVPLIDVKTTARTIGEWHQYEVRKNGYDIQATYYMDTHTLLTGERRDWVWIVVTKEEPFMCRVFDFRNLSKDDPLYEMSGLRRARELIGLDNSVRLGRMFMWRNAALETIAMQDAGMKTLSPARIRSIWQGYEQEDKRPEYYA